MQLSFGVRESRFDASGGNGNYTPHRVSHCVRACINQPLVGIAPVPSTPLLPTSALLSRCVCRQVDTDSVGLTEIYCDEMGDHLVN